MPPKKTKKGEVSFHVSNVHEIPSFYETSSPEDILEALKIGAALFETVRSTSIAEEVQALEERAKLEIAAIQDRHSLEKKGLEESLHRAYNECQTLRTEHSTKISQLLESQKETEQAGRKEERERVSKQLEGKIHALQYELEMAQERQRIAQERKSLLEMNRDSDIREAEERTRTSIQQVLDEKERSLLHVREELEKANLRNEKSASSFQEILSRQTDEIRSLKDSIQKKSSNVKNKGNSYEEIFRNCLVSAYGTNEHFRIEETSHRSVGHAGDILMKWGHNTIMWEVKNYEKPVPEAEVTKFKRDMSENANVRIGVMVSRYTNIVGKSSSGDFHLEFIEGKMFLYISNMEQKSDEIFHLLMIMFRLYWDSNRAVEEEDVRVEQIRKVESMFNKAEQDKKDWILHKANMTRASVWMSEQVESSFHDLKCLLKDMQGVVEKIKDIPADVFRDSTGDERMQQIIQTILSVATYEVGKEVTMNELVEQYISICKIGRETAKTNIKSVLYDTVLENKAGKPTKIHNLALKPCPS